jgi:DNA-binding Xre family transcriptional regulator
MNMSNPHHGSSFDDFLEVEGMLEDVTEVALQRVFAWQLEQERIAQGISKTDLAQRIGTSRSQLDRILSGEDSDVRIGTLSRAAHALGKRIDLRLV